MNRPRRLLLLLVPLAIGLLSAALPSRAQQASGGDSRYVFADTTLLRDTLGISFEGLFPLADSLRTSPDTLRALAIRYSVPLWRLVAMADSMRAPVDSLFPRLERERYNPLAMRGESTTDFTYGTGYNVVQNRNSWTNNLNMRIVRGVIYYSNITSIQMDKLTSTRSTTRRQTRHSENEAGWRVNPQASVGLRAVFDRFTSNDPASINAIDQPSSQYQLSIRTRQQPNRDLQSEINLLSGVLSLEDAQQRKRGGSGEINGHVTYDVGDAVTNDVTGSFGGDLSHIVLKKNLLTQDTHDYSRTLRATSILWPSGRMSLSGDVNYRNFFTQTPNDSNQIQDATNANLDVTGTARLRGRTDQQLNLSQTFSGASVASAVRSGQSKRRGNSTAIDGRLPLFSGTLEGRFGHDYSRNETPQLADSGGYGENSENRQLEGTFNRQFGRKLIGRVNARISLARFRYFEIGRYPTLPVPRDQAQQSYRIEAVYTSSTDFNTSAALEVGRIELVNIPSASVVSNNVARTYRAEWNWTFRLLRNLTATQRNSVLANYTDYPFNSLNNRLSLDYTTTTTLNAVLTPRVSLDLSHYAETLQGGNYLLQSDGIWYFLPADDNKNYQLGTKVTWTPVNGVALAIEPRYRVGRRYGTANGVAVLQRDNGNLTFTGSANLNLNIGKRGRLTGSVGRSYQDDLTNTYGTSSSVVKSQFDQWTSNLQFTWRL